MSKIKKYYYSWPEIIRDVAILRKKLKKHKFDYIVAISRGGLIPATLLAYSLGIKKIRVVGYSYYYGTIKQDQLINVLPLSSDVKNCRVLLVDDIVDSGATMAEAIAMLKSRKNRIISATLHYKKSAKPVVTPDYYTHDLGSVWIVYPWEIGE